MATIEQALEVVLQKIKSGEKNLLKEAEDQTRAWEEENLAGYAYSLATYMAQQTKDSNDRVLCGILLRGIWSAKDPVANAQKQQKWIKRVPPEAQTKIKEVVLNLLTDLDHKVGDQAAQIVARIALIELPLKKWDELIPLLLAQIKQDGASPHLKTATLKTIGFICEEITPEVLSSAADQILTAVIHGMRPQETDPKVKLAACKALFLALDFCKRNFENPAECPIIVNAVLAAMTVDNEEIQASAYSILTEIATLHYDILSPFMRDIFQITLNAIKNTDDEDITKHAMEFWCTICDVELDLKEDIEYAKERSLPAPKCECFIKGALPYLAPLLTHCLTLVKKDVDRDDWTVSMHAGVCLSLIAQVVEDEVVPQIMPFVEANITQPNWKQRDAAVLAFGCILEGPQTLIQDLITQALNVLLLRLKDEVAAVRDTSAWTFGSILKFHPQSVVAQADDLLKGLCEALADPSPRVAANACCAIHNFALSFENEPSNPFHKYFVEVVKRLLSCADRKDSVEEHLQVAAYESLNVVLATSPQSADADLKLITITMTERLDATFSMETLNQDDVNKQNQLQGLLCGVLQVLALRMQSGIIPHCNSIMAQVLRLFQSKQDSGVYEEGLLTVAAIATITDDAFERYMNDLAPHLLRALNNSAEHEVCCAAVGLVGDISRALGLRLLPYCDRIVTTLLNNLQSKTLDRSVKPPILSAFGDIALAIGGNFEKYENTVMQMLKQAAETVMKTEITPDDYDLNEYINFLREGICEAYTGIIQGMRSDNKVDKVFPHWEAIMRFISHIAQDNARSEAVTRGAVGIIGDLATSFQGSVRHALSPSFILKLVEDCYKYDNQETKDVAVWTKSVLAQLGIP